MGDEPWKDIWYPVPRRQQCNLITGCNNPEFKTHLLSLLHATQDYTLITKLHVLSGLSLTSLAILSSWTVKFCPHMTTYKPLETGVMASTYSDTGNQTRIWCLQHAFVCIYFGSHTCISYLPEHSPTVHPLHLIFGLNHELHLTGALNYVTPSMGPTT